MAWTNPGDGQTLDLSTGTLVLESHWDALRRNLDFLGGADGYSGTVRRLTVVSKTAAYTATNTDDVILVDASAGAVTITLPTASGIAGRQYIVVKTDSSANNAVTVDPNGAETIDGQATVALSQQWAGVRVISDGANWVRASDIGAHNVAAGVHGLPANVNVLGNRSASGEFVQRGTSAVSGTAGGAESYGLLALTAVTFAVAFSSTPVILVAAHNNAANIRGVHFASPSTTGFTPVVLGVASSSLNGEVHWIALGS